MALLPQWWQGTTYTELPDFDFRSPPPIPLSRAWWSWGRPQRSTTYTSNTKPVPISSLKHLTGHPLGTTTTLVGHWVGGTALVTVVSGPPPEPTSWTPSARSPSPWSSETSPSLAQMFVLMVFACIQGRNVGDDETLVVGSHNSF